MSTTRITIRGKETVSDAADKAAKSVKGLNVDLNRLEKGGQAAGGKVGELAGRFKNLDEALGGLFGPQGIAVAGIAVWAAMTVAVVATAAGIVAATRAAGEAADELDKLGLITSDTADSLHETNDALDAVGTSFSLVSATIAESFAPEVRGVAVEIVALNLAVKDISESLGLLGVALKSTGVQVALEVVGFGRLVDLWTLGSRGLDKYRAEALQLVMALTNVRTEEELNTESTGAAAAAITVTTEAIIAQNEALIANLDGPQHPSRAASGCQRRRRERGRTSRRRGCQPPGRRGQGSIRQGTGPEGAQSSGSDGHGRAGGLCWLCGGCYLRGEREHGQGRGHRGRAHSDGGRHQQGLEPVRRQYPRRSSCDSGASGDGRCADYRHQERHAGR